MQIFKNPQLPANRLLLVVCLMLPWLNPFTSAPSTSVIPLLLSWMLAACALLLVIDEAPANANSNFKTATPQATLASRAGFKFAFTGFFLRLYQRVSENKWGLLIWLWFLASAFTVPEVIDRALTAGVLASITSVWITMQIGKRAANSDNGLLRWLLVAWLLAALISSALAVLQYLDMASELTPWVNQPRAGDAFANLRQRNQFASLTSIGLVALLGMVATARSTSKLHLTMVWCALGLLSAGLACSVSRTGAVQWAMVVALVLVWTWKDRKNAHPVLMQMAIGAPLLVIVWSLVLPWIALQLNGVMGASLLLRVAGQAQDYAACGGRRVLWSNALQMLAQHPWQGWGLGETDFAHYSTDYQSERFCDLLDNAHNLPLHLALEFGLPFALVSCIFAVHWVFKRINLRNVTNAQRIAFALLLVVGLHSMLEYPLWYGPFQMTLGLALGLWSASARSNSNPNPNPNPNPNANANQKPNPSPITRQAETGPSNSISQQLFPMLIGCVLFLACLYAAWDYNRVAQIYRQPDKRDAAYRDNPMQAASQSWLFKNQVDFARLMTQSITKENAQVTYDLAMRVLHYSPEPRVVERAIESLRLLGKDLEAEKLVSRIPIITPHK
jgi:Virulence factor membrane-bound polymerase, C-terminal/O-Antigen ligase/Protein glycosylation ligase